MAEIKNTFLKGKMNQDLDSRILPNGEYREARNLSISRSEGSTVGEFENVLGNTGVSSLSLLTPPAPAGTEIIGQYIDENSSMAYFMATDWNPGDETRAPGTAKCYIVSVDLSATNAPTLLVEGSFLNFNQSFRITGINLIENQLFWTDNLNQPRKINITQASVPANFPHYTNEDQISVAKYAPFEPILVMDRVQTSINGLVTASATIVVADSTGVKVGDIITDRNKITGQQITELVTVIGIPTATAPVLANTLTLSKAVTITDTTLVDFSRPSMTNKKDVYMSNHSSGSVTVDATSPGLGTIYTIGTGLVTPPTTDQFIYNGENGIPKIGDLVSGTGVDADTRVASVSIVNQYNSTGTFYEKISITLNKETTLSTSDQISISDNPDYNSSWQGDEKFLEDKFVRFSYRFKFEDNEYSLMAPFSQPMFIPKQYSQFGGGLLSSTEDMDDAYKSTIITWFENNINNILLKIPMTESTAGGVITSLKITNVDIIYKESDALAVKVLETIDLSLLNPTALFPSITFNDAIHGSNPKYFLQYDYSSTKPYKTLPNNQVTRVSDKVPIRALAQEVIGNRIVYGNYLDRHTGPNSIAFSATAVDKSTNFDNYTQFPKHQLKQDRTYQVGFVLSDRYGRQSDVILSSYDNVAGIAGSTVFHPYNSLVEQTSSPILDWLGNALNVTLNEAIASTYNSATGTPGIYSVNNPLGWYSYKIVVKQTEQEYYNVYLPGFVNGYPITGTASAERNKSFFTTLLGDNVNKIPRDLVEVGPNDRDYTSSENILIRINNPRINNKAAAVPRKNEAWNAQYYPGNIEQEIIQIATVRDMEIAAIPFKPNAPGGEYGASEILQTYVYETPPYGGAVVSINETPEPTGAIPWGTTGPDASLYNADSNLFVIRGNQSENVNNPIGAYVTVDSVNDSPLITNVLSMVPFLSVVETKPVESLLDIYWETSLSGNLVELNALVDSQYGGLIGSNFSAATFPESITDAQTIGSTFNFTDGSGSTVTTTDVTINNWSIDDGSGTPIDSTTFSVAINIGNNGFDIKPGTGKTFFYDTTVDLGYTGVYTITVDTSYTSGAGTFNDTIVLSNISLTNIVPTIDSFSQPTSVTTASGQTIIDLSAVNGSANTLVNTQELVWSLSPAQTDFAINSSTGVLTSINNLITNTTYNVGVIVTDLNGNGLSSSISTITFTVGAQRVNKALCQGRQGSTPLTRCGDALQVQFLDSSTVSSVSSKTVTGGGSTVIYPAILAPDTYNVESKAASEFFTPTTGALKQGTLYITPTLTNVGGSAAAEDDIIGFTIQRKPIGSGSWAQAVDSNGDFVYNETLQVGANDSVSIKKVFDIPGEYRVISTLITGGRCSLSPQDLTTTFNVEFGDDIYSTCTSAPE